MRDRVGETDNDKFYGVDGSATRHMQLDGIGDGQERDTELSVRRHKVGTGDWNDETQPRYYSGTGAVTVWM